MTHRRHRSRASSMLVMGLPVMGLVALLGAAHAQATTPDVQAARARATAAREDEKRLAQAQAAALARVRTAEAATDAAVSRIRELAERRQAQATRLARRANDIVPFLPQLLHLANAPGTTLLAAAMLPEPASPEQAQRGGDAHTRCDGEHQRPLRRRRRGLGWGGGIWGRSRPDRRVRWLAWRQRTCAAGRAGALFACAGRTCCLWRRA